MNCLYKLLTVEQENQHSSVIEAKGVRRYKGVRRCGHNGAGSLFSSPLSIIRTLLNE